MEIRLYNPKYTIQEQTINVLPLSPQIIYQRLSSTPEISFFIYILFWIVDILNYKTSAVSIAFTTEIEISENKYFYRLRRYFHQVILKAHISMGIPTDKLL